MKSSEARSPTQTADDGAAQPLAALGRRASMSSPEAIASAMAASLGGEESVSGSVEFAPTVSVAGHETAGRSLERSSHFGDGSTATLVTEKSVSSKFRPMTTGSKRRGLYAHAGALLDPYAARSPQPDARSHGTRSSVKTLEALALPRLLPTASQRAALWKRRRHLACKAAPTSGSRCLHRDAGVRSEPTRPRPLDRCRWPAAAADAVAEPTPTAAAVAAATAMILSKFSGALGLAFHEATFLGVPRGDDVPGAITLDRAPLDKLVPTDERDDPIAPAATKASVITQKGPPPVAADEVLAGLDCVVAKPEPEPKARRPWESLEIRIPVRKCGLACENANSSNTTASPARSPRAFFDHVYRAEGEPLAPAAPPRVLPRVPRGAFQGGPQSPRQMLSIYVKADARDARPWRVETPAQLSDAGGPIPGLPDQDDGTFALEHGFTPPGSRKRASRDGLDAAALARREETDEERALRRTGAHLQEALRRDMEKQRLHETLRDATPNPRDATPSAWPQTPGSAPSDTPKTPGTSPRPPGRGSAADDAAALAALDGLDVDEDEGGA